MYPPDLSPCSLVSKEQRPTGLDHLHRRLSFLFLCSSLSSSVRLNTLQTHDHTSLHRSVAFLTRHDRPDSVRHGLVPVDVCVWCVFSLLRKMHPAMLDIAYSNVRLWKETTMYQDS